MMVKNTHDILKDLVARVTCKPGWQFRLDDDEEGFRLNIFVPCDNSRADTKVLLLGEDLIAVTHFFPIPVATYNEKSWRRWIFECCRKVEDHELGEWFLVDGNRPFAPCHAPGYDPYTIRETQTEEEARMDQRGNIT